jgi:4'-phosphopantetheinyl transferase EntD
VIERLLPAGVASAETRTDPADAVLFPAEAAVVAGAVDKRRREFTTVRHCARAALARLGQAAGPILPGLRGAPVWPDGIVGSMTHCVGYRAAAVAPASVLTGLGIDCEPHEPLPGGVLDVVASPAERAHLTALAWARPGTCWDRLLFSAKESVYKVWSPLTGEWLDFLEADLSIDPVARTFTARLLVPGPTVGGGPLTSLSGRFLIDDGIVFTAVVLPSGSTTA